MSKVCGILGAGQLSQMLEEAGKELGLRVLVFSEKPEEKSLRSFFSQAGLIVFENEFLDCALLEKAASGIKVEFQPMLSVLKETQDKLRQKHLFQRLGLPTSAFDSASPGLREDELEKWANRQRGRVLKWARLGYDGGGVFFQGKSSGLESFLERAVNQEIQIFAEDRVDFVEELAMIGVRTASGEFHHFPLVKTVQESGVCKKVFGPIENLSDEKAVAGYAKTLCESLNLVGAFGLECFKAKTGEILLNEAAPRVHNSGHYSQEFSISQFQAHWRAVLGMPIPELSREVFKNRFGMLNLLGPETSSQSGVAISLRPLEALANEIQSETGAKIAIHLYDKKELRPKRKMGHVNLVAAPDTPFPLLDTWMTRLDEAWRKCTA